MIQSFAKSLILLFFVCFMISSGSKLTRQTAKIEAPISTNINELAEVNDKEECPPEPHSGEIASDEQSAITIKTPTLNKCRTKGIILKSRNNRPIYAFQGIPYVDQPERFQKPGGVKEVYDAVIDATKFGNPCAQATWSSTERQYITIGHEDCLFINVFTPKLPEYGIPINRINLPVMVFIHGGQFVQGDASSYMPTNLLDEDVILVTFNYRLGAFGFYTYGSLDGNLALYDQNIALYWVNKYIRDFGGDNKKVTLFGQDAGAVSALYHLITTNDDDKTLFHSVIAQSGSPLDAFAFDNNPDATSDELAIATGCEGQTDANCMGDAKMDDLALAVVKAVNIPYPILAPHQQTTGGMLTDTPLNLLKGGAFNKLPLMLGTCAQEGSYIFGVLYSYYLEPEEKDVDGNYLKYEMVPDLVERSGIDDPLEFVSSSLYETYLNDANRTVLANITPGMIDMSGALFSKSGILETTKLFQDRNNGDENDVNIFLYSFEYKGENTTFLDHFMGVNKRPNFTREEIGVTRGDDLLYLFNSSSFQNDSDIITMNVMANMWTNFAIKQNPIPAGSNITAEWKPYSNTNQEYLIIGQDLTSMEGYEERYTILVDYYEQLRWPPLDPDYSCSCDALGVAETGLQNYMISMIVFVVLFCATIGMTFYVYFSSRTRT